MKERLDVLLVKRNLAESREKAKAIIMSGNVFVEGQREDKAGTTFSDEVQIEIKGHTMPYVSRGGLKLEKAIANFDVDLEGKVCTDPEWCEKGVRDRCRERTACVETQTR